MRRALFFVPVAAIACNPDPSGEMTEQVDFLDADTGPSSGERGSVHFSEVFWSGAVHADGTYDTKDAFIELRNEGMRALNLSGWRVVIEGGIDKTIVLPANEVSVDVGAHVFLATKDTGCFPTPDFLVPELALPIPGDSFGLTLQDSDERLIDVAGSTTMPPFAGGYDLVRSRSMERVELMFGGDATVPAAWHFYTPAVVEVPNDDRIAEDCLGFTLASPGRANSPDYSGAYATGSLE
jgi:hypothetical protein